MSYDLQRTSYNMMIYEVCDYSCTLLDTSGTLMSQNIGGVSHFIADMGVVIKDGIDRYGLENFAQGDVLITNHQAVAGQHLNNIVIYTPFFLDGVLTAFPAVRAHWVDVGGLSTGFGALGSTDPWSEGLQLNQLKIYEAGKPDNKLLQVIADNIRFPQAAMGDLRSQIAACRLAERRQEELYKRYGARPSRPRWRSSIRRPSANAAQWSRPSRTAFTKPTTTWTRRAPGSRSSTSM
jgi:N-methylhydantoinase B